MRRLICLTLLITFCLSLTASAVTVSRWNRNVGNPAGAATVAKSGAAPDAQYLVPDLSYEQNRTAMNPMTDFGIYVTGCLVPPADGDYTFVCCSDDQSEFALSPDADIANAVQIASQTGWNAAEAFTTLANGVRSNGKATLKAGQSYAFYFAHQNGAAGGTNGSMGWTGPAPIGDTPVVIDGAYITALPGAVLAINAKPIVTARVGTDATLTCSLPLSSFPGLTSGGPTWFKKEAAGDVEMGKGLSLTIPGVTEAATFYAKVGDVVSNDVKLLVQKGLVHRYTFNAADVDSIIIKDVMDTAGEGAWDAMLYDLSGKDKFSDTALTLGNTNQGSGAANASYVDMPNGILSSLNSPAFTIEVWYTQITPSATIWQRIFDIGTANGGEDKSDGGGNTAYFYLCPNEGSNQNIWYGYKTNNSAGMNNSETNVGRVDMGGLSGGFLGGKIPLNQEKMYAVTWDEVAGISKLYYQGVPLGHLRTRSSIMNPVQFVDNNCWLGRSQWGDPGAGGTFNEFRVWDVALKANEIARHVLVGPEDVSLAPAGACATNATKQVLDMNGDCTIDLVDYAMFVEQWLDAGPITQ